jgi:hypothetical protein
MKKLIQTLIQIRPDLDASYLRKWLQDKTEYELNLLNNEIKEIPILYRGVMNEQKETQA